MKYEWLKKQSAQQLIIIFSGWGFSSAVFGHLLKGEGTDKYDVLFVSDYRSLTMQLPEISSYQECFVIAWSFGVSAFATWLSGLPQNQQQEYQKRFDCCIAVNGSMNPIDRHHGIPEVIMQKTIDSLSQESFESFASRCFGDFAQPKDMHIDIIQKKQELEKILSRDHKIITIWDIVWIARHDKIFASKNLNRAWQDYNENCLEEALIQYCDAPHAPFQIWPSWDEIITASA